MEVLEKKQDKQDEDVIGRLTVRIDAAGVCKVDSAICQAHFAGEEEQLNLMVLLQSTARDLSEVINRNREDLGIESSVLKFAVRTKLKSESGEFKWPE